MAIILYCPAYAVSGLIAATSHSETLERIPPGASVSIGNPVPCSVYQILASPLSTYGTPGLLSRLPFREPAYGRAAATTGTGVARGRTELERLRRPAAPQRSCRRPK